MPRADGVRQTFAPSAKKFNETVFSIHPVENTFTRNNARRNNEIAIVK